MAEQLISSRSRCQFLVLVTILTVLTGFYLWYQPTKLAHYTDPLFFLSGAESIADGNGYRFAAHVGTPRIGCHPPLQSAWLAIYWKLYPRFPENIAVLYMGMIACVLTTFFLVYRYLLKRGVPSLIAGLLILSWGLSAQWGSLVFGFMSDVLFGLLWMVLAAWWLEAAELDSGRFWFITGVLVSLMYLTRTAAL